MSTEIISLLVVQIIGFLTLIVTTVATSIKASAERKLAAQTLLLQQEAARLEQQAAREEWKMKTQRDDELAARDRAWALEDRRLNAENNRQMTSRIDSTERIAKKAYAATGIGVELDDDDPPPPPPPQPRSKRLAALQAAKPAAVDDDAPDFGAAELFRPESDK